MYLFILAAHEVLPTSDAYCGISQSHFCLTARRRSFWAASRDTPGLGFAVGHAVFAHPQVWNVMVQHQVIQAWRNSSKG